MHTHRRPRCRERATRISCAGRARCARHAPREGTPRTARSAKAGRALHLDGASGRRGAGEPHLRPVKRPGRLHP